MNSWRNWDEDSKNKKPNTIQEHIEFYRQQAMAARSQQLQQEPEDQTHAEIEHYFEDMKPKFTGQTKVLIKNGAADSVNVPSQFHSQETSRLSLNPEMISTINVSIYNLKVLVHGVVVVSANGFIYVFL